MSNWTDCAGIRTFYAPHLSGGGADYGQDFVRLFDESIGAVDSLCEWAAGPGFIGFGLLGAGFCNRLTLLDVNPEAAIVCNKTIRNSAFASRVDVVTSDCFDDVAGRFDAVVANPPHSSSDELNPQYGPAIIYSDPGWRIHKKFYSQVAEHLHPGGIVIMQEHGELSAPDDFTEQIEVGGLRVRETFASVGPYYFLISERVELGQQCRGE